MYMSCTKFSFQTATESQQIATKIELFQADKNLFRSVTTRIKMNLFESIEKLYFKVRQSFQSLKKMYFQLCQVF